MARFALKDDQCVVAVCERGLGWIVARSDKISDTDLLMECSDEDNGFNSNWSKDLSAGLYLLTVKGWGLQSYDGEIDTGVDVKAIEPLYVVPAKEAA